MNNKHFNALANNKVLREHKTVKIKDNSSMPPKLSLWMKIKRLFEKLQNFINKTK